MKDKIMIGIICFLVGAILATGTFFIYSKVTACNKPNNNTQIQMPNGQAPNNNNSNNQNGMNGQPPEMPSQDNNQQNNNNSQPPEMPNDNNNQNSNGNA